MKKLVDKNALFKMEKKCKKCKQNSQFGGSSFCLKCKINSCQKEFLEDPFKNKWSKLSVEGQEHFTRTLKLFYLYLTEYAKYWGSVYGMYIAVIDGFGDAIEDRHMMLHIGRKTGLELRQLLSFAEEENRCYGFTPLFSTMRLEECFKKTPEILDFWTTFCFCYDMTNYLADLYEKRNELWRKKTENPKQRETKTQNKSKQKKLKQTKSQKNNKKVFPISGKDKDKDIILYINTPKNLEIYKKIHGHRAPNNKYGSIRIARIKKEKRSSKTKYIGILYCCNKKGQLILSHFEKCIKNIYKVDNIFELSILSLSQNHSEDVIFQSIEKTNFWSRCDQKDILTRTNLQRKSKDVKESQLSYFGIKEENEWEGETWIFYCWYDKTQFNEEEQKNILYDLNEKITEMNQHFSISSTFMTSSEVETLVKYSESGYMSYYNFGERVNLKKVRQFTKCQNCLSSISEWYKGNYWLECTHSKLKCQIFA